MITFTLTAYTPDQAIQAAELLKTWAAQLAATSPLPPAEQQTATPDAAPRGRGRPPGSKNRANEPAPAPAPAPANVVPLPTAAITLEEVRAFLAGLSREQKGEKVKELLLSYGTASLSGLKPEHYPELLAKARAL